MPIKASNLHSGTLAHHPLVILPAMDNAHIPDLDLLTPGSTLDADTVQGYNVFDIISPLTIEEFQAHPATGDWTTTPGNLNDNDTGTKSQTITVDTYLEVDWGYLRTIAEFRHYGSVQHGGSGRWKIQYWDGFSWVDLNTEIPTRVTANWSGWVALTVAVITTKIRVVATTLDTDPVPDWMDFFELEIRG